MTDIAKAAEELDVTNKVQLTSTTISQCIEEAATTAVQEIKVATMLVTTFTGRLTATTMSYKDTLAKTSPHPQQLATNMPPTLPTMDA